MDVTVVGYGMGKVHCEIVRFMEGLNLYAVCDFDATRRQAAQDKLGVKTFENLDQVLEDSRSGLIVLATPHDTHAPLAIKAMDAGKHVVVEKPMCLNAAEADAMIDASRRNNVVLSVFQNRRWDCDYLTVKRVIDSHILGDIFLVESSISWYGQQTGWRNQKAHGGGHIYDWGAHLIDQALQLVDSEPDTIFSDFQHRVWGTEVESFVKCLIRFQNQLLYEINISGVSQIGKPRWRILGELGALVKQEINFDEKAKVRTRMEGFTADMEIESVRAEWRDYYTNISQVINKGAELAVKPEEARKVISLIEAAIRSAETGESIKVSPA